MIATAGTAREIASRAERGVATRSCNLLLTGWSLIEVMVGLLLGTLATGAAVMAFQTMRSAYVLAAEQRALEQRGGALLDTIGMLLRHAGWHPAPTATLPPPLGGRDDCGQPTSAEPLRCGKTGIAGSDALLIRFGGDHPLGDAALPDRYLPDCSGNPVAIAAQAARAREASSPQPGGYLTTNLLYIAEGSDGEPQLLCRYPGSRDGDAGGTNWSTGALARGVETLQLRYGIDRDADGRVDSFVRASELAAPEADAWRQVLAVQMALVLRSEPGMASATATPAAPLALLPARTAGERGDDIVFVPRSRPAALRRVFATTVWLRNAPFCAQAPC